MLDAMLHIAGISVLVLVCIAGLASLVFGLPGTFVILGAALVYAWLTGFTSVTWATIAWLTVLALAAEGIELLAAARPGGGARPSRRTAIAAIAGGIAGAIAGAPVLFGLGSLPGALAGTFVGAALAVGSEGHDLSTALRTGFAALRGRLLGFIVKLAIAVTMAIVLLAAAVG